MTSPITPSIELVEQWWSEWTKRNDPPCTSHHYIATKAARWGADQELEACCVLMDKWGLDGEDLVECRRPKPPSLKEQALEALEHILHNSSTELGAETIRRALEALPND